MKVGPLTHLSLFSGIGGMDLAAEWVGFTTVGQCEIADYPIKVLEKHWPDVPRWRDIRDVSADSFMERTGSSGVTLLTGGFPCQPFSVAGKHRGKKDDRYLWPEMLRVIKEIRPAWVVGENVAGFVTMALDQALSDLETEGYEARAFVFPACAVNAPHERQRIFVAAHANREPFKSRWAEPTRQFRSTELAYGGADVADADGWRVVMRRDGEFQTIASAERRGRDLGGRAPADVSGQWWEVEPGMGRVVNGVSARVDRLRCLGNAVVPQQVYPILQAIAAIELGAYYENRA